MIQSQLEFRAPPLPPVPHRLQNPERSRFFRQILRRRKILRPVKIRARGKDKVPVPVRCHHHRRPTVRDLVNIRDKENLANSLVRLILVKVSRRRHRDNNPRHSLVNLRTNLDILHINLVSLRRNLDILHINPVSLRHNPANPLPTRDRPSLANAPAQLNPAKVNNNRRNNRKTVTPEPVTITCASI